MKKMLLLFDISVMMITTPALLGALPHVKAELTFAPNVPPPIMRQGPAIVEVDLIATRRVLSLTPMERYNFWTFNGHVPGPFIRARVGDWLEVHISNTDTSGMPHNVDFHAVMGPGGGAMLLTVAPGQRHTAWFRLRTPGLFVYHCAVPPIVDHIANGMFGMILVEPKGGLPHVDREFYIMQSEIYAKDNPTNNTLLDYSHSMALAEQPRYVVFNGQPGGMMYSDALKVKTGEHIRIYFGDAGPNLISSFHIIGTLMQDVYLEGSLANPPLHEIQTIPVPPGSAAILDFTPIVPGAYTFVDHSIGRVEQGASGQFSASGPKQPAIYRSEQDGPPTE